MGTASTRCSRRSNRWSNWCNIRRIKRQKTSKTAKEIKQNSIRAAPKNNRIQHEEAARNVGGDRVRSTERPNEKSRT